MDNVGQNINRSFNVISDRIGRNGNIMSLLYTQTKQNEINKSGIVPDASENTRQKAIIQNTKNRFPLN
jgi:hypothetical protein